MKTLGKKTWLLPDMYWPEVTSPGVYVSHESVCVLNTSRNDCDITINLYYEDRDPILGLKSSCNAMRTHHIRMDNLLDKSGNHILRGIPYAAVVICSVKCVVQYTRVDTTQSASALMTSLGYSI